MSDIITDLDFLQWVAPRFWNKVDKAGLNDCWLFTGAKSEKGYGRFWYSATKYLRAHRLAYVLAKGPIPEGMEIIHSCDNPLCCQPAHLSANTHQKNMDDMTSRNRTNGPKGRRQHLAKMDEEKVLQIRQMYTTGKYNKSALARLFNIRPATVNQIVTRLTWTHI